jgi:hypothetical protein
MLSSATISDEVDKLIQLSMHRPIRLFVDPQKSLARGLTQEFVRVKRENEQIVLPRCGSEPLRTGSEPEPNHWFGSDSVQFGLRTDGSVQVHYIPKNVEPVQNRFEPNRTNIQNVYKMTQLWLICVHIFSLSMIYQ